MIAPFVGITLPTVAPIPACTSGIAATWPWMIGKRATFSSCRRASGSRSGVHTFTGTRPVVISWAIGIASIERIELPEQTARGFLRSCLVHARLRAVRLAEEIVRARERHGAERGRPQVAERGALADQVARLTAPEIRQRRDRGAERDDQAHRRAHVARADRVQVSIARCAQQ